MMRMVKTVAGVALALITSTPVFSDEAPPTRHYYHRHI